MILITDGGSTKCDWIAIDKNGKQTADKIRTKGLNPAIVAEKKLKKTIKGSDELMAIANDVTHVYFYGAGCGTEKPRLLLKEILEIYFPKALVEVKEDTYAAVRACINSNDEAAVVCILGTGSNCSYYDGKDLHQRVNSLGFILMDDASGNYFGKQLIRDYYFNKMPDTIRVAFAHKHNLDADFIKYNLYKQTNPSAYLADHAEFMFINKDSEYIQNLIIKGIRLFAENMILQFKKELDSGVPVHFAGSIAFFGKDEIKQVADELGFKVGNFVRRPIEGLVGYHINNLQMEIAIIAHDGKKAEMVQFLNEHSEILHQKKITLISTGTTGEKVKKAGFEVNALLSGPLGGDAQIAARVAEGKCNMVLFFRDPLDKHPHEPDILMLMRLCDVHNVPLATNEVTAKLLVRAVQK